MKKLKFIKVSKKKPPKKSKSIFLVVTKQEFIVAKRRKNKWEQENTQFVETPIYINGVTEYLELPKRKFQKKSEYIMGYVK